MSRMVASSREFRVSTGSSMFHVVAYSPWGAKVKLARFLRIDLSLAEYWKSEVVVHPRGIAEIEEITAYAAKRRIQHG